MGRQRAQRNAVWLAALRIGHARYGPCAACTRPRLRPDKDLPLQGLHGDGCSLPLATLERDADWAAPLLWRSEFRDILAGCMRRTALALKAARKLRLTAKRPMVGAEHEMDTRLALELVGDSDCSACDCEFAGLAITLGVDACDDGRQAP